jgi:hypothetical protein
MSNDQECLGCGQKFKRSDAAVMCTVCGLWAHKKCSGVSDEFFKFLAEQHKATGRAYWACRACNNFAQTMNAKFKELHDKADNAVRLATESKVETSQLREQVERDREKTEKRIDRSEMMMLEEINLREEKRKNVVIYGLDEPTEIEGWKRVESDKRKLNEIFTVLELNIAAETDVEFCRRVGEKSERTRPLVVGFFTEWSKSTLLKNCRYLQETELSYVSITNDLTEKQRRMEKELITEAERRNAEELTDEDRAKNLVWKVVGRKGQRKLIKSLGQEWEVNRRGAPAGRGLGRGQAARAALGGVNLLPTRGATGGAWQPSRAAATAPARGGVDSRKRQRSDEEMQQRKRGTGVRGRPSQRTRGTRGRLAGPTVQATAVTAAEEDVPEASSEEDDLLPVSQLVTRSEQSDQTQAMVVEVEGEREEEENQEEEMAGIRLGAN